MLDQDDLWLTEELPIEEPSELLKAMPEIRQYLDPEHEEDVGLRSVLERPEVLSKAWWRSTHTRGRTRSASRHSGVPRAA